MVVAVGTTIGVSGELSPPQAESAIPAPTATARTTKCLTRHIRPRKVARIKEGTRQAQPGRRGAGSFGQFSAL